MLKNKPVLGRGLDALIPHGINNQIEEKISNSSSENESEEQTIKKLPLNKIVPNPFQPRTHFEPEKIEDLKNSILMNGLIQPITVRKLDGIYQLVSGERRYRACKEIGYKEIPAYIIEVLSDEAMLALALIENIQREKLNAIEVAYAYKRLMEECNLTYDEIGEKVGKDRTTIVNSIRLLKLPDNVQESIIKEEITMGHARALINLSDHNTLTDIVDKIKREHLSVRKVEELVKRYLHPDANLKTKKTIVKNTSNLNSGLESVEDLLRKKLATKVVCKQASSGSGYISIEFYSSDELERLIELFHSIES